MSWFARASFFALLLGCGGDSVLHTCDIRESSCQFDVFLAVQDVRGSLWDPWLEPPAMRVISEASYRDEVIAAHDRALREQGMDYVTPALKLLHMIDPNEPPDSATNFTVAKVAAYYEASTKRVTIVDHGKEAALTESVQILAHELVHAAQDRDIGFERLYQDVASTDNRNAVAALLEGEATMYELLVDAKQRGWPKGEIDWRVLTDYAQNERIAAFESASPYRITSTQLSYPLGGLYMSQAYTAGGPLEVRRVLDRPPLTAAAYMTGVSIVSDRPPPPWRCYAPNNPPGFQLLLGDELGAFGVYALATRIATTDVDAWERARQWTGDRFYLYTSPNDPSALVVVWLLRFQDAITAERFEAALLRMPWAVGIQSALDGDTLHVITANSALDPSYDDWRGCLPL